MEVIEMGRKEEEQDGGFPGLSTGTMWEAFQDKGKEPDDQEELKILRREDLAEGADG